MKKSKKLWLAVALNGLLPGTGYLYLGRKKQFGILILLASMTAGIWYLTNYTEYQKVFDNIWCVIASLIFAIAFAVDAYQEGKRK